MIKHLKNILLPLLAVLALTGCKDDPQRHLQLAQWYSQKGLIDEAILEYREVTRLLPTDVKALSRGDYELLADAHYRLALMYTKKRIGGIMLSKKPKQALNYYPPENITI